MVAALAVTPGQEVRPGELAEACWGESVPRTWTKQVQALVSRVRRRLGSGAILTTTQGYALGVDPETIDSVRFERLVERARRHRDDGDPERAIAGYERALALWRGPPFSDVAAWPPASVEAARLDEMRRAAEEDLLEAHLDCGEHHSVIAEAERLVRAEPLSERRWAILALALYRSGRQADALAALRRMRDELDVRLGVDPGAEITALETDILRQDPRLDRTSCPACDAGRQPVQGPASVHTRRLRRLLRTRPRDLRRAGPARRGALGRRRRPLGQRQVLARPRRRRPAASATVAAHR